MHYARDHSSHVLILVSIVAGNRWRESHCAPEILQTGHQWRCLVALHQLLGLCMSVNQMYTIQNYKVLSRRWSVLLWVHVVKVLAFPYSSILLLQSVFYWAITIIFHSKLWNKRGIKRILPLPHSQHYQGKVLWTVSPIRWERAT